MTTTLGLDTGSSPHGRGDRPPGNRTLSTDAHSSSWAAGVYVAVTGMPFTITISTKIKKYCKMKSATPNNTLQYHTIIKNIFLQVLYKLYKTKQYSYNIKQNIFTISRYNIVHDIVA